MEVSKNAYFMFVRFATTALYITTLTNEVACRHFRALYILLTLLKDYIN
jgi:hypothetical protein